MRCFETYYDAVTNFTARFKALGLRTVQNRRKDAELRMVLKIVAQTASVDSLVFPGELKRMCMRGRLRRYIPVVKRRVKFNFFASKIVQGFDKLLNGNSLTHISYCCSFKPSGVLISRKMLF